MPDLPTTTTAPPLRPEKTPDQLNTDGPGSLEGKVHHFIPVRLIPVGLIPVGLIPAGAGSRRRG
ncbi:hypothetical protein, partial [Arthrobacter sp. 35/47]|uniref:hypothetical protein n=1 Tax=Arthrobacter sp. 35/47 TaxID=269454 RepID=UPI0020A65C8D